MKIAVAMDIHLDSSNEYTINDFITSINVQNPYALFLGGDISDSKNIKKHLDMIYAKTTTNIFFVLGNHDFYGSSIKSVNKKITEFIKDKKRIKYLDQESVIQLSEGTVLLGVNGWSDGLYGEYKKSNVILNDYLYIDDLKNMSKSQRFYVLNNLGAISANKLKEKLAIVKNNTTNIIVLTHVPFFVEACVYQGLPTNELFLPHFSCKQCGDVVSEYSLKNPTKKITVFSGHTHNRCEIKIDSNISVYNAEAHYGDPKIQKTITI